jgi:isoleucyl-tRNA synthetase
VLETVCRVAAPLLPLTAETVWRGLTGGRSVHLTDWPSPDDLPGDAALVAAMDRVREVASTALAVRKAAGLRVRQPLATMAVSTADAAALQPFSALLADEVNVAAVTVDDLAEGDPRVRRRLSVNARAAGPRLGREVQQAIKAAKSGDWWLTDDGVVTCGGHVLADGEYTLELVAADDDSGAVGVLSGGGYVWLDTELSDDLVGDGVVNDLLRVIQQARRDAGLQVSDRIVVTLAVSDHVWAAVVPRLDRVRSETLAVAVERADPQEVEEASSTTGTVGDGETARASVRRAQVK